MLGVQAVSTTVWFPMEHCKCCDMLIAVSTQSDIFRGKFPDVSPRYRKTVYNFVDMF
jgi:hypothetical protein